MVEAGGGGSDAMFPVMFFDGETEVNVGLVNVDPSLEYKAFQLLISQRIGISPNQITIYLVDRNKSKLSLSSSEARRRIPITGKANFSVIAKVKDGSFLAVLKRSRKNRRPKPKSGTGSKVSDYLPAQNFLLMRRINDNTLSGHFPGYFHQNPAFGWPNYADEEDVFLNWNRDLYLKSFPKIDESFNVLASEASCAECRNEKKLSPAAFHCCVNDSVIIGFRSPAGAISRPIKLSD